MRKWHTTPTTSLFIAHRHTGRPVEIWMLGETVSMYKLAMHMYDDVWNVMDSSMNYAQAVKSLKAWREFMPEKKFRLELHTVAILND
jgi:hypothetical protein